MPAESIYFDGRHYDALFPGLNRQAEIDFYLQCIRSFDDPVLELGCGTGRLTIPLAQAGVPMTGLDSALPMLSVARQKAAESGVVVEWVQADCRDFHYDAAAQINHIRWYYRREGQEGERTAELNLRMYYPQEIDALLHYNGFEVTAKYGDYDETPFASSSRKQLIVCKAR